MQSYLWYQALIKPSWAPPAWLFGPVWSVLYLLIAISFGAVFYVVYKKRASNFLAIVFTLNLLFNLLFTPIQFGLKNNLLASLDILTVLGTLIWDLICVYKYKKLRWVFWINLPYLIWVSFATILQLNILYLNW